MTGWSLVYDRFEPEREGLREALCTLGNGVFCTRGAAPEAEAGEVHYPGTYAHGVYDRLWSHVAGRDVQNEDLVNLPNWLPLTFRVEDGPWFHIEGVEVLSYRQELDLSRGLLSRRVRFRDHGGRTSTLEERRIVSMDRPHLAALQWTLVPEDWSGRVGLRSGLDGRVVNSGVERYLQLDGKHLEPVETRQDGEVVGLAVRTVASRIGVAEAARTRIALDGEAAPLHRRVVEEPGFVAHAIDLDLAAGRPLRVEKVVSLRTRLDATVARPLGQAMRDVVGAPSFPVLLDRHAMRWRHLWDRFGMDVTLRGGPGGADAAGGDSDVLATLRLHLFHLVQTTSKHTVLRDAGVPARGLHGEAYRGHVFWDEVFILPVLTLRVPEITRALLLYRYRRLGRAVEAAKRAGYAGAMFPWQSGSTGREESQRLHLNPRSGRWLPDHTLLQRHVGAAVAYNVWRYHETTRDVAFLCDHGAELFLQVARFWASIAEADDAGTYHIRGVVGPDEYHEGVAWRETPGVDDNAYTNVMAAWVLWRARDVLAWLPADRRRELEEELGLTQQEVVHWDDVSRRMHLPRADGLVMQFDGFERLEELDWGAYHRKYGDIHRLDRILEAEGDDVRRYQVCKQADLLMLAYLFSPEELEELLGRLGVPFGSQELRRHVEHYLARTAHGSTLSRAVHTWVLSRLDRGASWDLFRHALQADVRDVQGGTTREGVHLGAMAATVDVMQRCYTGLEVRDGVLRFRPALPDEVGRLRMPLRFRGRVLQVDLDHERLRIVPLASPEPPVQVAVGDRVYVLEGTEPLEVALAAPVAVGGVRG